MPRLFQPAHDSYTPAIQLSGGVPRYVTIRGPHYRIDWDRLEEAYMGGGGDYADLEGDGADRHVRDKVEALEERERNIRRGRYEAARRECSKSPRATEDEGDAEE